MGIFKLFKKKVNSKEVEYKVENKSLVIKTILFPFSRWGSVK